MAKFASDCEVLSISIWQVGKEDSPPVYNLIGGPAITFQYYEDILWPSYGGSLLINDMAINMISTLPIEGFEKIVVHVKMAGEEYKYAFRIWGVSNRVTAGKKQVYNLNLISEEGLLNEGLRVTNIRKGRTSDVVKNVVQEFFNYEMTENQIDDSSTHVKVLPTKKSPFTLIRSLQTKTISEPIVSTSTSASSVEKSDEDLTGASHIGKDAEAAKGSAGYYFYQTRFGFNFKSIDVLASQKPFNGKENPFYYGPGKTEYESNMKIQEIQYGTEINLMKSMREGSYSSLVCFFNINTGKYNERLYSLKNTWDDMVHLGNKGELPYGQSSLSTRPTRIMSTVVNHENWNMGEGIADSTDEERDTTFEYTDNQMDYLSQSYARSGIMEANQLTISLTGHLELVAGDLIEVVVPNQIPDVAREKNPWDQQYSGTYLITKLNHQFDITNQTVYTVLDLIRDSTGIRESIES